MRGGENMNKKGFTLVELLVVIAIIGLLSTLAVVALSSARQKARDSKRMSDLKQIQTALEIYFNDHNQYPVEATPITLGVAATTDCLSNPTNGDGDFEASGATCENAVMGVVPEDPTPTQSYQYSTDAGGTTYTIEATLEGVVGNFSGDIQATPTGILDVSP